MKTTSYLKRVLSLLGVFILSAALFTACNQSQEEKSAKTADLVYVNWAEGIAYTNLAKVVLEDKMNYEVEITSAGVGPAYTAVANGDSDAFMETWLPTLHADYVEQYKEDIIDLGTVYDGTKSGLVVPEYVDINKISELNDVVEKFDGKITGIDAGAGIMKTTSKVIEDYGLNYELVQSSGPAMTSALQKAYDNKEPIVVTGWKPHWMFGRFDLKFLEQDEELKKWKEGNIHIMGRKNLMEDKPELAAFLSNMKLTDAELSDLMVKMQDTDRNKEEVAKEWLANNEEVVQDWIPAEEANM